MNDSELHGILVFLREAERLKNVTRSAWTSSARNESVAEHSWRLCLMAVVLHRALPEVDCARLLKICIVHDLGEAIHGDIPAVQQSAGPGKSEQERADLRTLATPLPLFIREEILSLWEEYEAGRTPEAKLAKALDKLETILQHTQGANPPGFDYTFNLDYGRRQTDVVPLLQRIRAVLDEDTRRRASGAPAADRPPMSPLPR